MNMSKTVFNSGLSSLSAKIIVIQQREQRTMTDILLFLIYMYHFYFCKPYWCSYMCGFYGRDGMCVYIYMHIWLHVGLFFSYKLRCQFTFTFPCLITRWIWFLGRSVWLQWLQPDISQCQAFPRRVLPMSPSLDLETPSAIPSPQWKLKNVLTLKSLLYTDMQYSGTFQNNHVHFANVLLSSRCWARAARAECCDNRVLSRCCQYTLVTLKCNWALFISSIII